MAKKVRSAKGEMVDFDLLKIKEQMASAPPPTDVAARQDFIEKRMRRRVKKVPPPAPRVQNPDADVLVDPKMPATEELTETPRMIEEPAEQPPEEKQEEKKEVKKTSKRRQRARPMTPEKPKTEDTDNTEE